ncbi:MAG: hypothetical protein HY801_00485 [Candidatus Lindowbacteria bacterium]|nr:hypothetical protein [Candidatus Lindowbacteria bacterium]
MDIEKVCRPLEFFDAVEGYSYASYLRTQGETLEERIKTTTDLPDDRFGDIFIEILL